MSKKYDVIVIGAGPAGYVAAIRCAQLGLKTACIDNWLDEAGKPSLGGTCLNAGCMPSKALLESSELFHRAQHEFAEHGLEIRNVKMNIGQMQKRKAGIVASLTSGVATLFKSNGIEAIHGKGCLEGPGKVKVTPPKGKASTLQADKIIIAAGSVPAEMSIAPFDGDRIVDSTGALDFDTVPGKLGIIGAGIIGLELGSVWARLGSEVTLLETQDALLPMVDKQIAREAGKQFRQQGLNILLGARVLKATTQAKGVKVEYVENEDKKSLTFDKLIVAVGRRPATDGLFSKDSGLELDDKGFIAVNERYRTNLPDVYAVGDVIGGAMLAHKGSEEGVAVAEIIAGQSGHVNYDTVPSVIYTAPEIAWVGKTEDQASRQGFSVKTGSFPFAASGRAKALQAAQGMVKLVVDADTDEVIGAHMIGPYVSELIAEIVLGMEFKASAEDIARTMHAHPTLSEVVHEAALAVDNRAIHFANRRK